MTLLTPGRDCPHCGAPTPYRTPACGYCKARLAWPEVHHTAVGELIAECDARKDALPGGLAHTKLATGCRVEVAGNTMSRGVFAPRMCDAAVAVTGAALDPRARLGVCARFVAEGEDSSCYVAFAHPGSRTLHLRRQFETAKTFAFETLGGGGEVCPLVAPVGATNRIELRCVEALLEIHVNGQLALAVIDARFGYGKYGLYVGGLRVEPNDHAAVEIQRIELAAIG